MAKEVLHVVPHGDGWAVKRAGVDREDSTHGTQKDAIEAAREQAKERDDIVIHRPDGTIRERVTYMGPNGQANETDRDRSDRSNRDREDVHVRDVASVGSRVSWGAILAGAMVALGLYLTFSALALATGLSLAERTDPDNFPIGAAIVAAVTLLAAMFLGGFVASRMTVGEQPGEAITYGVLVWGTVLAALTIGGLSLGLNLLDNSRRGDTAVASSPVISTERMQQDLGLNQQQADRYSQMVNESRRDEGTAESVAWWTFATLALSLLAAIGGGIAGAGPEFILRGFRREDRPATTVAARPA